MSTTETQVRERPILFSGAMIRAILDGRKCQTRRVMKPQPVANEPWKECPWRIEKGLARFNLTDKQLREGDLCPYGQPGDRLWVREAFSRCACDNCRATWPAKPAPDRIGCVHYPSYRATHNGPSGLVWRPSIHMPRWASRITLEITDVRVERVQEISEEDARAEGVWQEPVVPGGTVMLWRGAPGGNLCSHAAGSLGAFRGLWDSLNAPRGYGWDANPWVWCLTFRLAAAPQGAEREG